MGAIHRTPHDGRDTPCSVGACARYKSRPRYTRTTRPRLTDDGERYKRPFRYPHNTAAAAAAFRRWTPRALYPVRPGAPRAPANCIPLRIGSHSIVSRKYVFFSPLSTPCHSRTVLVTPSLFTCPSLSLSPSHYTPADF